MAVGLADLLRHLGALGHAAAQADNLLGVGFLGVGQRAQRAVDPLFRVVADGAGVQHHNVRLGGVGDEGAVHSRQHPHNVLAVGHVLLAAVGVHHGADRTAAPGVALLELLFKIPLAGGLLRRDQYLFSVQIGPPCPSVDTGRYLNMLL